MSVEHKNFLKPSDAWSTVLFADPLAVPLSKLLAKFKVHPNLITIFSYIPIFMAAYFFWQGNHHSLFYGALLWQCSIILDFTDGKVARINNQKTKLGKILDEDTEMPRNLLVFFSLLYSQFFSQGQNLLIWGIVIFAYHYGLHFLAHHIFDIRKGFYEQDYCTPESKRPKIFKRIGCIFTAEEEIFLMFVIFPLIGIARQGIIIANLLYTISVIYLILRKKHYAT